jgi:hypothetical protein
VTTAVDPSAQIPSAVARRRTHVIIDRIGWLI